MKICPTCRKTYADENLNFCLEDGSVLTIAQDAPPTMVMPNPPATNPNPIFPSQQHSQQTWAQPQPTYSVQPKKKSKAWMWITGMLALGLLLCGGGFVGLFAFLAYKADKENAGNSYPPPPPPANNRTNSNPGNTSPGGTRSKVSAVDMSEWAKNTAPEVNSEYANGELVLGTKQKGYYYVLVSQDEQSTENADTRITVRNADDLDSSMGYGLVFHSNPQPLKQDYCFLIDTKKKRYRVVRHVPSDEPVVVRWTNSSAIKDGSQENVLEVRDNSGNIDLYINGEKVTTIRNTYGYKGGVAGVYSGDAARAAFSKLEIRR